VLAKITGTAPMLAVAKQSVADGQAMAVIPDTPAGREPAVQIAPSSTVESTIPIAFPPTTLTPTVRQSLGVAQAIPSRAGTSPGGSVWLPQLVPPFDEVVVTLRPPDRQLVAVGHATASRPPTPLVRTDSDQVDPPSLVVADPARSSPADVAGNWRVPTATQLLSDEHEIPPKLVMGPDKLCIVQIVPPSVVSAMPPTPVARHSVGEGHATPFRSPSPAGSVWLFHVVPSVVLSIYPLSAPTAKQSVADVQAIAFISAPGMEVVDHVAPASFVLATSEKLSE